MKHLLSILILIMIITGCETAGDRFPGFPVKEKQLATIAGHTIWNVWFIDESKGFILISKDSVIKTNDGCKSFTVSLVDKKDSLRMIRFYNDSLGFVLGNSNRIYKTTDGGIQWEKTELKQAKIVFTDIVFLNKKTILVSATLKSDTVHGYIYRSNDGGVKWEMIRTIPVSALFFISGTTGFGCGKKGIIKSMDGGVTWQIISQHKANKILFINEEEGYSTFQRTLYSTHDGGMTWKLVRSVLNRHWVMGEDKSEIECLNYMDDNTLMFTLNARLIRVSNDGQNWNQFEFTRPYMQFQLLHGRKGIVYSYENLILVTF